jgi:hypothetical protein
VQAVGSVGEQFLKTYLDDKLSAWPPAMRRATIFGADMLPKRTYGHNMLKNELYF